jgi:fatty acid desaturase
MMRYVHVYQHHTYANGLGDWTSTRGYEHGWRAVYYWIRYAAICQRATWRGLFSRDASPVWRKLRFQYTTDTLGTIGLVAILFYYVDPVRVALFWHLPLVVVFINIGFFAWLTHAPAFEGEINGSLNTTNRWANVLMHNQGYHLVHHQHPGIHWTQIPSNLDAMLEVDERLIVPYWVTLPSAWRIALPHKFHNETYANQWQDRYRLKREAKQLRVRIMPYFGWI